MKKLLSAASIIILFAGCTPSTPSTSDVEEQEMQKIRVATSFYPLTHFAEQIGGDLIEVQQVTAQDSEPHSYEPTPKQMQEIYDADLLIFNGAGQDEWAERIHEELEESGVRVLIATEIVERLSYKEGEHEEHEDHEEDEHHEEEEHDHEHGEWDPHVWLDPLRVEQIVKTVAAELAAIDPSHAAEFNSNANAYAAQLQVLNSDMRAGLANCALDAVVVSHDAYRYLAHRYGFHTLEIAGLSPSAEPSPARLAELTKVAEKEGISHVFFETHVSPALSETLANEIGAETLVLHSIEALTQTERAAGKTYIDLMRQNLANLRTALECS